jgi:hypothetical protein
MARAYNPKDGKIRNMLIEMGWKVGSVLSFAEGHAIIVKKGKCPGCERKWTKEHRKCVPGLFPGQKEQCDHRECGM